MYETDYHFYIGSVLIARCEKKRKLRVTLDHLQQLSLGHLVTTTSKVHSLLPRWDSTTIQTG
jgi:hypothetical protein